MPFPPTLAAMPGGVRSEMVQALRANLVPGVVLWLIATGVVLAYYLCPAARPAFAGIAAAKKEWGLLFSAGSTALMAGLVPWAVLAAGRRLPPERRWRDLAFLPVFYAQRGAEVDLFYRLQARVFGDGTDWGTVATKTAVDQFVYSALWASPFCLAWLAWRDGGYTGAAMRRACSWDFQRSRLPVLVLTNWLVWTPTVCAVYSLPGDLQIPLFSLVACFWSLLALTLIDRR